MKTLTFLARSGPYSSGKAKACQDMVLSAAVFEQKIHYVFLDDGVFQLLAAQDPTDLGAKNISAAMSALELYGVDKVYVERSSLDVRGLSQAQLLIPVQLCDAKEINALLSESDMVFQL